MKVQSNLLKPLIEFYGEPNWEDNGRNYTFIARQWEEAFKSYDDKRLEEAAMMHIRSKAKTFPSIGDVMELLETRRSIHIEEEEIDCHPRVVESYKDYAHWWNNIMGRGDVDPYPHVMPCEKTKIIDSHIRSFQELNRDLIAEYDNDWRTICGLAWQRDWLIQVEKRISEANEDNRKSNLKYLKGLREREKYHGLHGIGLSIERLLLQHMTPEIRKEVDAFEVI